MSPPSISLIEDLTPDEIDKLTQLLELPLHTTPTPAWLLQQATFISTTLPSKLKRSSSLLPRLAMALSFNKEKAHLCPSHKALHPYLIRRIFLQVTAECTMRLSRLVSNPNLPPGIADHVKVLQMANSLWMSPDIYRFTFQCSPEDERFERIGSDCEACILAAVGGNIQLLSELRTSMLGRKKKRGVNARLLPLVEAWIEWTGMEEEVREKSGALAKEIRHLRREMQNARRQEQDERRRMRKRKSGKGNEETSSVPSSRSPFVEDWMSKDSLIEKYEAGKAAAAAQAGTGPFEDKAYEYENGKAPAGPFDDQAYEYDDQHERDHDPREQDHDHDNNPEGSVIEFYANRLSSVTQTPYGIQNASNIHPAFEASMVFQFQTNSSTFTLPARDRNPFQDQDQPQDPFQDQNQHQHQHQHHPLNPTPNTYTPSYSPSPNTPPTTRTRTHSPPPAAWNNPSAKNASQTWKRQTGYSESVYSRAMNESEEKLGRGTGTYARSSAVPRGLNLSSGHAREGRGRRVEEVDENENEIEEAEEEYLPMRKGGRKRDSMGDRRDRGDEEGNGRRGTQITSFGDFV